MGKFANEDPTGMVGAMVGVGIEVQGEDGFAAFGKPVPFSRKQRAMDALKDMGVASEKAFDVSSRMAEAVSRDRPHEALEIAHEVVDVTGAYRALATICTDG